MTEPIGRMTEAIRFSEALTLRCQPEIREAIMKMALAKMTKPSEYVRQAVIERLEADGAIKLAMGAK